MRVSVSDIALVFHHVVRLEFQLPIGQADLLDSSHKVVKWYYLETYDKIDDEDEDEITSETERRHSVGNGIYFRWKFFMHQLRIDLK